MERPCPIRLVWVRDTNERDPRKIVLQLAEHAAKRVVTRHDGVAFDAGQKHGKPGTSSAER